MSHVHLPMVPRYALTYHPNTRCHEVRPDWDPASGMLTLTWQSTGRDMVRVTDAKGTEVAAGKLTIQTLSDVRGIQTGQRLHFDRVDIDGFSLGYCVSDTIAAGEHYEVIDSAVATTGPDLPIAAFAGGTLLKTPTGADPVEWLEPGVMIDTFDHGPQPIRAVLRCAPPTNASEPPVCIATGSIAPHVPQGPLWMSGEQMVSISSPLADLYFGDPEVLVPARSLALGYGSAAQAAGLRTVVIFDQPELICADGLWVTSHRNTVTSLAKLLHTQGAQNTLSIRTQKRNETAPRMCLDDNEAALLFPKRQGARSFDRKRA